MVNGTGAKKDQFERISETYDEVHHRVVSAIHRFSQEKYYRRCVGGKVLDIGNGGQPPDEVMGDRIAATLVNFVGIDRSVAMLQRKGTDFRKVVGDGSNLPFKDDSFDYVIINGVLHHLGVNAREARCGRVQQFISEALRVSSRGLIVYELFTTPLLESVERIFAGVLRSMRTFVLSERTLDDCLERLGLARSDVASKTLAELTDPFYWYAIVMEHTWLRLPAFLSPFRHGFFIVKKARDTIPPSRGDVILPIRTPPPVIR
jgi:ubiquinone/menaquinone biosynthesis C-methylase UbiE